jgi:spermidine/putrescine transport system ATP-binding protein
MENKTRDARSNQAMISIVEVNKLFGSFVALEDVTLDIQEGEFFSLLGPSGCGKTTLLRLIGGFDEPSAGSIFIGNEPMSGIPPNLRPTNMVFQSYAIFPHLNVAENVAYGLKRMNLGKAEENSRVDNALEQVRLVGLGERMGNQLSGGQRQRVALARALVMRPKVLLLDEPLSALDKKLREEMQVELRHLQQKIGITFVLVTHDQYEALAMSDRIAVMFGGKIAQVSKPQDIYQHPVSRQVADFLGGMNFLDADSIKIKEQKFSATVKGFGKITGIVTTNSRGSAGKGASDDKQKFILGIRPERLRILWHDEKATTVVNGTVTDRHYMGEVTNLVVKVEGQKDMISIIETNDFGADDIPVGSPVRFTFDDDAFLAMSK